MNKEDKNNFFFELAALLEKYKVIIRGYHGGNLSGYGNYVDLICDFQEEERYTNTFKNVITPQMCETLASRSDSDNFPMAI